MLNLQYRYYKTDNAQVCSLQTQFFLILLPNTTRARTVYLQHLNVNKYSK